MQILDLLRVASLQSIGCSFVVLDLKHCEAKFISTPVTTGVACKAPQMYRTGSKQSSPHSQTIAPPPAVFACWEPLPFMHQEVLESASVAGFAAQAGQGMENCSRTVPVLLGGEIRVKGPRTVLILTQITVKTAMMSEQSIAVIRGNNEKNKIIEITISLGLQMNQSLALDLSSLTTPEHKSKGLSLSLMGCKIWAILEVVAEICSPGRERALSHGALCNWVNSRLQVML